MTNLKPARQGEKISRRARLAWAKRRARQHAQTVDEALEATPTHVATKSPGDRGAWFCCTCGAVHPNNWEAHAHAKEHPKHAWFSFDSDRLEEP